MLRAALELAGEGGYEVVQMRAVAARAGVALGTVYRYFLSKDELLVSAMVDWTGELRHTLTKRPARGDTPADRVFDVLKRACRALERQPLLAAALLRAMASTERGVDRSRQAVRQHLDAMLEPLIVDVDHELRDEIIRVIGQVWQATLIGWSIGSLRFDQVVAQLRSTVHMLLDPDVPLPGRSRAR